MVSAVVCFFVVQFDFKMRRRIHFLRPFNKIEGGKTRSVK
jgi:hypothetical protein